MASAAPALYHDEPSDIDFSLTAPKGRTSKTTSRSRGTVTTFAGAAMVAAASMVPFASYASDQEATAYETGGDNFFVDERALLIDELRQYEQLESGWDGNEADIAPSRAAVDEAIQFVENLPAFVALPEPMVSSDGEVGLFWKSSELYLDVGFRGCGECSYFGKAQGQKVKGRDSISDALPIPSDLLSFFVALSDGGAVLV